MAKSSTRCGSPNHHRELATSLQHNPAASIARLQATSTGSVRASIRRVAGCTTSTGSAGHASAELNSKLTLHLDHPMGADHVAGCTTSTGSAGHASAELNSKLTLHLDHPMGADQHKTMIFIR